MTLIKTIAQLTAHLGNALAVSSDNSSILPYVQKAELQYIRKAVGDEQVDALAGGGLYTGLNAQLLNLLQKSLAFYTLYEWSAFSMGRQTDNGLEESGAGGTGAMAGRMWVYNDRKAQAIKNGAFFLDQALQLLIKNRTSFPVWQASSAGILSFNLLIQQGTQMGKILPETGGSYTLYLTLLPYFELVEARELLGIVGADLVANIKARRVSDANTPADLAILPYLVELVAKIGYSDALEHMQVIQEDNGLRITSEFDGINTKAAPTTDQVIRLKQLARSKANEAEARLRNFLAANEADYPDYTTSTAYKPAITKAGFMKNDEYATMFRIR